MNLNSLMDLDNIILSKKERLAQASEEKQKELSLYADVKTIKDGGIHDADTLRFEGDDKNTRVLGYDATEVTDGVRKGFISPSKMKLDRASIAASEGVRLNDISDEDINARGLEATQKFKDLMGYKDGQPTQVFSVDYPVESGIYGDDRNFTKVYNLQGVGAEETFNNPVDNMRYYKSENRAKRIEDAANNKAQALQMYKDREEAGQPYNRGINAETGRPEVQPQPDGGFSYAGYTSVTPQQMKKFGALMDAKHNARANAWTDGSWYKEVPIRLGVGGINMALDAYEATAINHVVDGYQTLGDKVAFYNEGDLTLTNGEQITPEEIYKFNELKAKPKDKLTDDDKAFIGSLKAEVIQRKVDDIKTENKKRDSLDKLRHRINKVSNRVADEAFAVESKEYFEKGEYGKMALHALTEMPYATLAADSFVFSMALSNPITTVPALMGLASNSITNNAREFYKQNGRHMNDQEAVMNYSMSTLSAVLQKLGADYVFKGVPGANKAIAEYMKTLPKSMRALAKPLEILVMEGSQGAGSSWADQMALTGQADTFETVYGGMTEAGGGPGQVAAAKVGGSVGAFKDRQQLGGTSRSTFEEWNNQGTRWGEMAAREGLTEKQSTRVGEKLSKLQEKILKARAKAAKKGAMQGLVETQKLMDKHFPDYNLKDFDNGVLQEIRAKEKAAKDKKDAKAAKAGAQTTATGTETGAQGEGAATEKENGPVEEQNPQQEYTYKPSDTMHGAINNFETDGGASMIESMGAAANVVLEQPDAPMEKKVEAVSDLLLALEKLDTIEGVPDELLQQTEGAIKTAKDLVGGIQGLKDQADTLQKEGRVLYSLGNQVDDKKIEEIADTYGGTDIGNAAKAISKDAKSRGGSIQNTHEGVLTGTAGFTGFKAYLKQAGEGQLKEKQMKAFQQHLTNKAIAYRDILTNLKSGKRVYVQQGMDSVKGKVETITPEEYSQMAPKAQENYAWIEGGTSLSLIEAIEQDAAIAQEYGRLASGINQEFKTKGGLASQDSFAKLLNDLELRAKKLQGDEVGEAGGGTTQGTQGPKKKKKKEPTGQQETKQEYAKRRNDLMGRLKKSFAAAVAEMKLSKGKFSIGFSVDKKNKNGHLMTAYTTTLKNGQIKMTFSNDPDNFNQAYAYFYSKDREHPKYSDGSVETVGLDPYTKIKGDQAEQFLQALMVHELMHHFINNDDYKTIAEREDAVNRLANEFMKTGEMPGKLQPGPKKKKKEPTPPPTEDTVPPGNEAFVSKQPSRVTKNRKGAINIMRGSIYGNPFSSLSNAQNLYHMPKSDTSKGELDTYGVIEAYVDWLKTGKIAGSFKTNNKLKLSKKKAEALMAKNRQAILESIAAGTLDGKPLYYFAPGKRYSHATALQKLVDERDTWIDEALGKKPAKKKAAPTEDTVTDLEPPPTFDEDEPLPPSDEELNGQPVGMDDVPTEPPVDEETPGWVEADEALDEEYVAGQTQETTVPGNDQLAAAEKGAKDYLSVEEKDGVRLINQKHWTDIATEKFLGFLPRARGATEKVLKKLADAGEEFIPGKVMDIIQAVKGMKKKDSLLNRSGHLMEEGAEGLTKEGIAAVAWLMATEAEVPERRVGDNHRYANELGKLFKEFKELGVTRIPKGNNNMGWQANTNLFNTDKGLPDSFYYSMASVALSWSANDAQGTLHNDAHNIAMMLHGSYDSNDVAASELADFRDAGLLVSREAARMGREARKILGIQVKNLSREEQYKFGDLADQEKLDASLGLWTIMLMKDAGLVTTHQEKIQAREDGQGGVFWVPLSSHRQYDEGEIKTLNTIKASGEEGKLTGKIGHLAKQVKGSDNFFEAVNGRRPPRRNWLDKPKQGTTQKLRSAMFELGREQKKALKIFQNQPWKKAEKNLGLFMKLDQEMKDIILKKESTEGAYILDRDSIETRNRRAEKSQAEIEEYALDAPDKTYFGYYYMNQLRLLMDSTGVNPLADKMHRFMVIPEGSEAEFIPDEHPDMEILFRLSVIQALGSDFDKNNLEAVLPEFQQIYKEYDEAGYLDATDADAFNTLMQQQVALEAKGKKGVFPKSAHALAGIAALQAYKAYKTGKAETVKTELSLEVDGITNGYAIGLMQFVGNLVDAPETVKQRFLMIGVGEKGEYESNITPNFRDAYRTTAGNFSVAMKALIGSKEEKHWVVTGKRVAALGQINSEAIIDPNQIVTKFGRDLMKYPFMIVNYSGGMPKIAQGLVKSLRPNIYAHLEKAHSLAQGGEKAAARKVVNDFMNSVQTLPMNQEAREYYESVRQQLLNRVNAGSKGASNILDYKIDFTVMESSMARVYAPVLEEAFRELTEETKPIKDALAGAMDVIAFNFMEKFDYEVLKYKGELVANGQRHRAEKISKQEKLQIASKLIRTHFPRLTGAWEDTTEDEQIAFLDMIGHDKETGSSDEYMVRNDILKNGKTTTRKTTVSRINWAAPGSKFLVRSVQNIDASVAVTNLMENPASLSLHDATQVGLHGIRKSVDSMNEKFWEMNKNYSIAENVERLYDEVMAQAGNERRGLDGHIQDVTKLSDLNRATVLYNLESRLKRLEKLSTKSPLRKKLIAEIDKQANAIGLYQKGNYAHPKRAMDLVALMNSTGPNTEMQWRKGRLEAMYQNMAHDPENTPSEQVEPNLREQVGVAKVNREALFSGEYGMTKEGTNQYYMPNIPEGDEARALLARMDGEEVGPREQEPVEEDKNAADVEENEITPILPGLWNTTHFSHTADQIAELTGTTSRATALKGFRIFGPAAVKGAKYRPMALYKGSSTTKNWLISTDGKTILMPMQEFDTDTPEIAFAAYSSSIIVTEEEAAKHTKNLRDFLVRNFEAEDHNPNVMGSMGTTSKEFQQDLLLRKRWWTATEKNIQDVHKELGQMDRDTGRDSAEDEEHRGRLNRIMGEIIDPLFRGIGRMTLTLNQTEKLANGWYDGGENSVTVNYSDNAPETYSEQSRQEVYVHELVHAVISKAVANSPRFRQSLKGLQKAVERELTKEHGKGHEWKAFLATERIPGRNAEMEAEIAKKQYEAAFADGSMQEFVDYALTNKHLSKKLIGMKAPKGKFFEGDTWYEKVFHALMAAQKWLADLIDKKAVPDNVYEMVVDLTKEATGLTMSRTSTLGAWADKRQANSDALDTWLKKKGVSVRDQYGDKVADKVFKANLWAARQIYKTTKVTNRVAKAIAPKTSDDTKTNSLRKIGNKALKITSNMALLSPMMLVIAAGAFQKGKTWEQKVSRFSDTIDAIEGARKFVENKAISELYKMYRSFFYRTPFDIQKLLNESKHRVEQARVRAKEENKAYLRSMFIDNGKYLEQKHKDALTLVFGYTEVYRLLENKVYSVNEVMKLVSNSTHLNQTIKLELAALGIKPGSYWDNQIHGLAERMIHQKQSRAMVFDNVKTMLLNAPEGYELTEKEAQRVDFLISMVALKEVGPDARALVGEVAEVELDDKANEYRDTNGIVETMVNFSAIRKRALETAFKDEAALMTKGYLSKIHDPHRSLEAHPVDPTTQKLMAQKGYVLEKTFPLMDGETVAYGLYYADNLPLQTQTKGLFSTTSKQRAHTSKKEIFAREFDVRLEKLWKESRRLEKKLGSPTTSEAEQVLLKQRVGLLKNQAQKLSAKKREIIEQKFQKLLEQQKAWTGAAVDQRGALRPIVNPKGEVVDFTIDMSRAEEEKYLKMNKDLFDVSAETIGTVVDKAESEVINDEGVDLIQKRFDDHYEGNEHEFINLMDVRWSDETFVRLPYKARTKIQKIARENGGKFMVEEAYLDVLFGYRNWSVGEIFEKAGKHKAALWTRRIEEGINGVVGIINNNIVVKTPAVGIGNMVSNYISSIMLGVPPWKIVPYWNEALKELRQIQNDGQELAILDHRAKGDPAYGKKMASRRRTLVARINANGAKELIDAGLYASITTEEMYSDEFSYKNQAIKYVTDKTNKLPHSEMLTGIVKGLYMADDTALYKSLLSAIQVSDFVGRYGVYKHMVDVQGKSKVKAYEYIQDVFVDYNIPVGKFHNWANSMGLILFYKYWLMIQRPIFGMLKHHPSKALFGLGMRALFGIKASNIFNSGVLTGGNLAPMSAAAHPIDSLVQLVSPSGVEFGVDLGKKYGMSAVAPLLGVGVAGASAYHEVKKELEKTKTAP